MSFLVSFVFMLFIHLFFVFPSCIFRCFSCCFPFLCYFMFLIVVFCVSFLCVLLSLSIFRCLYLLSSFVVPHFSKLFFVICCCLSFFVMFVFLVCLCRSWLAGSLISRGRLRFGLGRSSDVPAPCLVAEPIFELRCRRP